MTISIEEFNQLREAHDLKVCDWVRTDNVRLQRADGDGWGWRWDFTIEAETEKAVKVRYMDIAGDEFRDDSGSTWVSKRCFESRQAYKAAQDARQARQEAAFKAGAESYDKLIAWAKEHGVKGVRAGLRRATILAKIQEAGLTYAAN